MNIIRITCCPCNCPSFLFLHTPYPNSFRSPSSQLNILHHQQAATFFLPTLHILGNLTLIFIKMNLGGFSPEELEALAIFKEILAPSSLPSEILVDTFLIRWLRARGLRLPEAKAMLLESLRWRREFKMDKILDEEFPLPLIQSQPVAYCGLAKDGFATFIVPVGRHDVKGCLERYEAAEVERMQIQAMERVLQQVERDMQKEGFSHQVPQVIEILDFEG